MIFRNLTFFHFPKSFVFDGLANALQNLPLYPVGELEMSSRGFIPPLGNNGNGEYLLGATIGRGEDLQRARLITLGGQDRILPASVVNDLLAERLANFESNSGNRPSSKTRRRIKDEIIDDLLPRTLVKTSRINAMILEGSGLIAVDTTSAKAAESVVSSIRQAMGSFPATPLNPEVSPSAAMTDWVRDGKGDCGDRMHTGDQCELRDPMEGGPIIRMKNVDVGVDPEVASHLESGMLVTRLAVGMGTESGAPIAHFVIGDDLVIRGIKIADGCMDAIEALDNDDMESEIRARMVIMADMIERAHLEMFHAFKLTRSE